MTTIAFDTHKFIRTIQASGIPEGQAEAIAEAFRVAQVEADLATRPDLTTCDSELRHALQATEQRLAAKIDALRGDLNVLRSDLNGKFSLLPWMLGLLLAGVASLVIKTFF